MSDNADTLRAGRNAALLRAGIAVAAALALLVGVLLMDDARPPQQQPAPPEATPAASAPQPVLPSPAAVPAVESAKPQPAAAETVAQAEEAPAAEPAPAQAAVLVAPVAPLAPTPATVVAPVVSTPAVPVVDTAAAPANAAALAALANQPAAPMKDGYLLQLGVFGNPVNAGALQAELAAKGLPARVESRVVLGPFPDRKALDAAQRRLRNEHRLGAIVVPPRNAR